ncbi:MAG TPA: gliding motility-associated peptidyl-prolyl isomerase GldI [Flavobacteriaceae bacterium]|nr:gliding motility-associated peptidyl-prolyl isomerase GldI [Flavobacteriaceae bacterium]
MRFILFIIIASILVFTGCKSPEARTPISYTSGSFIDQSVERNIKRYQEEEKEIEKIMAQHPEHDYHTSASGFWYYYNTKVENDSLLTAGFGDVITFSYTVSTLKGEVIYTENELQTQRYAMDQEELFTGLREGLKLMKPGETVTFIFPSQKAYGYYGDENKIGTNVPLICKVTVNSIIDN